MVTGPEIAEPYIIHSLPPEMKETNKPEQPATPKPASASTPAPR
jgi:hypothetical protein